MKKFFNSTFQKKFFQKISKKIFKKFFENFRGIYVWGYKMTRFTLPKPSPIFWIVRQFWIFPQLIFLNFLTIAYSYIVYSRFPDSARISRIPHFWKNLPFPCSSRTLVRALVHESKNACSRWNVRPFFSTGVVGLYTILKVRLWRKFVKNLSLAFIK